MSGIKLTDFDETVKNSETTSPVEKMSVMEKRSVSLEDKYTLRKGYAFMTGIQSLVRLPLVQRELDQKAGLNTAGYISGYRGSPLGGYDQQLARNIKLLEENHIKFQPGVNEDLAATALWGTQQAELGGEGKYDGLIVPVMFCDTLIMRVLPSLAAYWH